MKMLRKSLLACGALGSLVYVGVDVLAAIAYPEYHSFTSRAVSELMATGAPTERLVDPFFLLYGPLMMAFAIGVWTSGPGRRVHLIGGLLFVYAALGLLGPTVFEMKLRGTGGDATQDLLHIALTAVMVVLIFTSVAAGASLWGRRFRRYSFATLLIMVVFGALATLASQGLSTGEPTPWLGLTERINIGAFLLWVVVLALALLREHKTSQVRAAHQGAPCAERAVSPGDAVF